MDIMVSAAIGGLLVAIFGLNSIFWLAVLIAALTGFCFAITGVGSQILLQRASNDSFRGRVSGFWGMIMFGGTALGGLLIGWASTHWGLAWSTLISGACCFMIAAGFAAASKEKNYENS
jgi:MFS family permease